MLIAKVIKVSNEILEDCPMIKGALARIMWYSYWQNLRINMNKVRLMELKASGKPIFKTKKRKSKPDYSEEEYEGLG